MKVYGVPAALARSEPPAAPQKRAPCQALRPSDLSDPVLGSSLRVVGVIVAALLFASSCTGASYRGEVSSHFDGARFHNDPPAHDPGFLDLLAWQLTRDEIPWPDMVTGSAPSQPPPHVDAGEVRVTFVNHSTFLVQMAGVNILTDPVWSDRVGPTTWLGPVRHHAPGVRFESLPRIDAVVISHNHYDHLDLPTLRRLRDRDAPTVISGLGNASLMESEKIRPHVELDWSDCRHVGAARICALPARHNGRRGLADGDRALWVSYWIELGGETVYFAGDTGYGDHFTRIRDRMGTPCVALLPIGAYRPRWIMKGNHMNPAEAVLALDDLGSEVGVAMHFATFAQSDEGMYQPAGELALELVKGHHAPFIVPDFGQAVVHRCRVATSAPREVATRP